MGNNRATKQLTPKQAVTPKNAAVFLLWLFLFATCQPVPAQYSVRYLENTARVGVNAQGRPVFAPDLGTIADPNEIGLSYARPYFKAPGSRWFEQHPSPGVFNLEYFQRAIEYGLEHNIRIALRVCMSSVRPYDIKSVPDHVPMRLGHMKGQPDLMTPYARQQYRAWLEAVRDLIASRSVRVDIAYPGLSCEPRTSELAGPGKPYSVEQYREIMRWLEAVHIEVFGAENVIANADVGAQVLADLWNQGVRLIRQDGYMSWAKEKEYESILAHPIAGRFFTDGCFIVEQWGGHFNEWRTDPNIRRSPLELLQLGRQRYGVCMWGFMGWPVSLSATRVQAAENVALVRQTYRETDPARLNRWWPLATAPPPVQTFTLTTQGRISGVAVTEADVTEGRYRNPQDFPWIGDSAAIYPVPVYNWIQSSCPGATAWDVSPPSATHVPAWVVTEPDEIGIYVDQPVTVSFTCGDLGQRVADLERQVDLLSIKVQELEAMLQGIHNATRP